MNGRLAATPVGDYVLVIDTFCRLTGIQDLFGAANTKSTSACVVRIADEPIEQSFENRIRTLHSVGTDAIRNEAKLDNVGEDGEDVAVAAFAKRTGIASPADLFDLSFRVYELDE